MSIDIICDVACFMSDNLFPEDRIHITGCRYCCKSVTAFVSRVTNIELFHEQFEEHRRISRITEFVPIVAAENIFTIAF